MAFIIPADPLTPRRLAGSVAPGARILRASEYAALGDAQALIAAAARQADGIVADARAAYEAERERGYADGRDQAQLKAAQHMLEAAGRTVEYFAGVESAVIDIVMQAVRKLIAGFDDRERVGAVVHGALSVVRNQKQVTLRMHPDDVPIAEERMNDWLAGFPRMGYVDVVADPRLAPGACIVESEIGLVEASLERQLAALRQAFERVLGEPHMKPDLAPGTGGRRAREFSYITEMMGMALQDTPVLHVRGRVTQVIGTIIKAVVPAVKVGEVCLLRNPGEDFEMKGEVVGFVKDAALLTPVGDMHGISSSTEVIPTGRSHMVPVGAGLLGRVLDGLGRPLDADRLGPLEASKFYPVFAEAPDPLTRRIIHEPLELGVRALDGLLTCGEGQRMGIFAAAGGGKSTLMGMLVKGAAVDVTVVALIGERGREVREFLEHELGEDGRRRSVIVCATSDKSSMERAKAAYVATAIAEYFRDQGKKVLFLMDSVTRFARAQREIGLAAGEPPTRRGYPPSVFATLPRLMERVGMNDKGSITALYTVLVEGDDMTEPVADETRSILDGHIVLSRKLAASNHYPAIDVLASASRVMNAVVRPEHKAAAGRIRELMAKYQEVELLVKIGEYKPGGDAATDEALRKIDAIRGFLRQRTEERSTLAEAVGGMTDIAEQ